MAENSYKLTRLYININIVHCFVASGNPICRKTCVLFQFSSRHQKPRSELSHRFYMAVLSDFSHINLNKITKLLL